MTEEQQQIPVPEPEPTPKKCGWCDEMAITEIELEKPQYTLRNVQGKKVKLIHRNALMAPVCPYHRDNLRMTR